MIVSRGQFKLDQPTAAGSNLLLKVKKNGKPFDQILAITDDKNTVYSHVDTGMWVALKVPAGITLLNLDIVGKTGGGLGIEVVERGNF